MTMDEKTAIPKWVSPATTQENCMLEVYFLYHLFISVAIEDPVSSIERQQGFLPHPYSVKSRAKCE